MDIQLNQQNKESKKRQRFIVGIVILVSVAVIYLFIWPVTGLNIDKNWRCTIRGGEMVSGSCGIFGCTNRCSPIYSDTGKRCLSSEECKGRCLITVPLFPEEDRIPEECPKNKETDLYECSKEISGACTRNKYWTNDCLLYYELVKPGQLRAKKQCIL
ncbi:hypothetical protein KKF05_04575 [Patescibacteria group bacterium]|nr:hypothetical protein [Patescibacteria group bacterium]MBU1029109.1 hypothetical protein [Patescibacteria group bacterium]MBU1916013.1 hypothetical protein [Patescibacteria group bacterium]